MLNKLNNLLRLILIKIISIVHVPITGVYWIMVRAIFKVWGERGLHKMAVGEYIGGISKKRSTYREEMLLKTIILFVNLRGKSCLDLACTDGFWSFRFGQFGLKNVTGIDTSAEDITRANFLKEVYAFPSYQFKHQDIFKFIFSENRETYDIILLLSILYHLPEQTDWDKFFRTISEKNSECLIIDSRWFEDDEYWYDKMSFQAFIKTPGGQIKKWRPLRKDVFDYLHKSGYEQVIEVNPRAFLEDSQNALGDGNPYSLENVADYITNNRSVVIAYKKKMMFPNLQNRLKVIYE